MKKVMVLAVALVMALAVPALAFGPGGGPGWGNCGYGGLGRMAALNLTPEQQDKMFQIMNKNQAELSQMRYDLMKKRLDARTLFADPKADEATITAKQKEIITLQDKLREKMLQVRLEQRKVLTPEQLQKLNAIGYGPGRGYGRGFGRGGYGPGRGYGPCFGPNVPSGPGA